MFFNKQTQTQIPKEVGVGTKFLSLGLTEEKTFPKELGFTKMNFFLLIFEWLLSFKNTK